MSSERRGRDKPTKVLSFLFESCTGGFFAFLVSCMRITFVFEVGFFIFQGFQWVLSDLNGFAHFDGFIFAEISLFE